MLTVSLLISIVFFKIASEIMWDEKRKMHFCVIFPLKRHKYHSIKKKKCIHFLHNNDITLSTSPLKLSALRKFNCIIHKVLNSGVFSAVVKHVLQSSCIFWETSRVFATFYFCWKGIPFQCDRRFRCIQQFFNTQEKMESSQRMGNFSTK